VTVRAQEAAPAAAKAEPLRAARIAVVDMQRISSETLLGKSYAAQIDALTNEMTSERAKKQNELQKIDDSIKALQDDLQKQASVLSPEATDKKQQEIVRKTRERQNYVEDGQVELQKMQDRLQKQAQNLEGEFQGKIKPFVDAVAKEKGVDVLLNAQVVLGAAKEFDLSPEVIVKADDAERAARAKSPAASTTGPKTPATAPATTPAKPAEKPAPAKP
jgi:Skp family chaperone for outer membrane proteins